MADATFNGDSLFSSGPHTVVMAGLVAARSRFAFAGFHGAFQRSQGLRTRSGVVRGTLRGDDTDDLEDLIAAIVAVVADGTQGDLVDCKGITYKYVTLDDYRPRGRITQVNAGTSREAYIQDYDVPFTVLAP